MGRCVSIYECEYLLNILSSNSLTQQMIAFLKLSQCDAGPVVLNVPHVCCARNDDSLMLSPNAGDGLHDKSSAAPSAVNTVSSSKNKDDSIIYKSSNSLLPKTNECGREKIENRIYSGQVSLSCCRRAGFWWLWQITCLPSSAEEEKRQQWKLCRKTLSNVFIFRAQLSKSSLGLHCWSIGKVRKWD